MLCSICELESSMLTAIKNHPATLEAYRLLLTSVVVCKANVNCLKTDVFVSRLTIELAVNWHLASLLLPSTCVWTSMDRT